MIFSVLYGYISYNFREFEGSLVHKSFCNANAAVDDLFYTYSPTIERIYYMVISIRVMALRSHGFV